MQHAFILPVLYIAFLTFVCYSRPPVHRTSVFDSASRECTSQNLDISKLLIINDATHQLRNAYMPSATQTILSDTARKLGCRVIYSQGHLTNSRNERFLEAQLNQPRYDTDAMKFIVQLLTGLCILTAIIAILAFGYYVLWNVFAGIPTFLGALVLYSLAALSVWFSQPLVASLLTVIALYVTVSEYASAMLETFSMEMGVFAGYLFIMWSLLSVIFQSSIIASGAVLMFNIWLFNVVPAKFYPLFFSTLPDDVTAEFGESSLETTLALLALYPAMVTYEIWSIFQLGFLISAVAPFLFVLGIMALPQYNLPATGFWVVNVAFVGTCMGLGYFGLELITAPYLTELCFFMLCTWICVKWLTISSNPFVYWTFGMVGISFTIAIIVYLLKNYHQILLPSTR